MLSRVRRLTATLRCDRPKMTFESWVLSSDQEVPWKPEPELRTTDFGHHSHVSSLKTILAATSRLLGGPQEFKL